ncbi:putative phospholipase B-like 2 [Homalodisca vitripennis]|nr:putative phospholipase B-like 2 [Homalodisca vitripennis]
MLKILVFLIIVCCSFVVEGKFLKKIERVEGSVNAYAYTENNNDAILHSSILCALYYNNTYSKLGWDVMQVQTNPTIQSDTDQARCAGELEGLVLYEAIYIHYYNNIKQWCKGRQQLCDKVYAFLDEHLAWVNQTIIDKDGWDPEWHHVVRINTIIAERNKLTLR